MFFFCIQAKLYHKLIQINAADIFQLAEMEVLWVHSAM